MARPRPCIGHQKPCPTRALTTNITGRCARCRGQYHRTRDQGRGSSAQRGYGAAHRKLRSQYEPAVRAGMVTCWRCEQPITPDQSWDLGHDDHDRSRYRGPEHARCNRQTAGRGGGSPS